MLAVWGLGPELWEVNKLRDFQEQERRIERESEWERECECESADTGPLRIGRRG